MVRTIVKDALFLGQKSGLATPEDMVDKNEIVVSYIYNMSNRRYAETYYMEKSIYIKGIYWHEKCNDK